MARRFAAAIYTRGQCDVCGFDYLLKDLRYVFVQGKNTRVKACHTCWDPDHPQNFLPQAVRRHGADPEQVKDPRPDPEAVSYPLLFSPNTGARGTTIKVVATGVFAGYSASVLFPDVNITTNWGLLESPLVFAMSITIGSGATPGQDIATITDGLGNQLAGTFTVS